MAEVGRGAMGTVYRARHDTLRAAGPFEVLDLLAVPPETQMGELFGVVRQVANDLSGQTWESLTNAQLGSRKDLLDRLRGSP